ncbi:hypothetical protein BC940DRAFT_330433 [Gongronella butleri]|nr:hypothetical protein BC940DRAFT_371624 [Gongronella butleri]KAI8072996.1 hypothetical protein BC940DRAFT_330433 [Gongronella butleri]
MPYYDKFVLTHHVAASSSGHDSMEEVQVGAAGSTPYHWAPTSPTPSAQDGPEGTTTTESDDDTTAIKEEQIDDIMEDYSAYDTATIVPQAVIDDDTLRFRTYVVDMFVHGRVTLPAFTAYELALETVQLINGRLDEVGHRRLGSGLITADEIERLGLGAKAYKSIADAALVELGKAAQWALRDIDEHHNLTHIQFNMMEDTNMDHPLRNDDDSTSPRIDMHGEILSLANQVAEVRNFLNHHLVTPRPYKKS